MAPLLSITFHQGFWISKNIGHPTSGSGGKKTVKRYLKSEHTHTHRQTHTRTDISTYRKHRPRGPMLWKQRISLLVWHMKPGGVPILTRTSSPKAGPYPSYNVNCYVWPWESAYLDWWEQLRVKHEGFRMWRGGSWHHGGRWNTAFCSLKLILQFLIPWKVNLSQE